MRIIIPSCHRDEMLKFCLDALMKSSISYYKTVIVYDGTNDDINKSLADYPVKVLKRGNIRSAAKARNLGAAGFEGDILVFLDSDVEVKKNAIKCLIMPIKEGKAEATVGNYSEDVEGMNFAQKYKHLYISKIYSRRTGYIKNHFWTALCAVKMSVFSELGGFDEYFKGALGEDTEFGQRLTLANKRILAVPDAMGRHLKKLNIVKLILNDLYKGTNAVYLSFINKRPITDNRHSTMRDVMSVILAYSLIGCVTLIWFLSIPIKYAVLANFLLLTTFIIARADLLSAYLKQGKGFLIKSVLMTFSLDLVRGVCILLGIFKVVKERLLRSVFMQGK